MKKEKIKEFLKKNIYFLIGGAIVLSVILIIFIISITNNKDNLNNKNDITTTSNLKFNDSETTSESESITEEDTTEEEITTEKITEETTTEIETTTQEVTTMEQTTVQQVTQITTEFQTQKLTEPPTPEPTTRQIETTTLKPTEAPTEVRENEYAYNEDGSVNIKNSKIYNQLEESLPKKVLESSDIEELISIYSDSYLEELHYININKGSRYTYTACLKNKTAFYFYIDENNNLIYGFYCEEYTGNANLVLANPHDYYLVEGYTYLN